MNLPTPEQITIAVTVFERTEYIVAAIESALQQTIPVRVIVVEDCARTTHVRDLVVPRFGDRITYYRNPVRRGLFGNWNACCEYTQTEWISILHDDDLLAPNFVESMVRLGQKAGPMGVYFCRPNVLELNGHTVGGYQFEGDWRLLDLALFAESNLVMFPGQLLHRESVIAVGGFYVGSQFAGDWDMWFKLAFHFGSAQTHDVSATVRSHEGAERGTNKVVRLGRKLALDYIQARRNFALLRQRDPGATFDRTKALRLRPISTREMVAVLPGLGPRMTHYLWGLLMRSTPPTLHYRLVQMMARILGPKGFRAVACAWKQLRGQP